MARNNRQTLALLNSIFIIVTLFMPASVEEAQAATTQFPPEAPSYSCARPAAYEMKVLCAEIEADILAATVRIELHTQYVSQGYRYTQIRTSHATIMAGRYLVTHNHFKFSLTKPAANGEKGYLAISLRRADGTLILDQAPLEAFTVVHADAETLVLEFLNAQGVGLFSALGLPSANFLDWQAASLQPGTELAQIDWDGKRAHVDWASIEVLYLNVTVPQLQMGNFILFGCSGGGVFWNGQHIGNNWTRNIENDPDTGEITHRYSIIALNSSGVLDLAQ